MHYGETSKSRLHELGHPHFIKEMQSSTQTIEISARIRVDATR